MQFSIVVDDPHFLFSQKSFIIDYQSEKQVSLTSHRVYHSIVEKNDNCVNFLPCWLYLFRSISYSPRSPSSYKVGWFKVWFIKPVQLARTWLGFPFFTSKRVGQPGQDSSWPIAFWCWRSTICIVFGHRILFRNMKIQLTMMATMTLNRKTSCYTLLCHQPPRRPQIDQGGRYWSPSESESPPQSQSQSQVMKALKMSVIHVVAFIVSWTPYTIMGTW